MYPILLNGAGQIACSYVSSMLIWNLKMSVKSLRLCVQNDQSLAGLQWCICSVRNRLRLLLREIHSCAKATYTT